MVRGRAFGGMAVLALVWGLTAGAAAAQSAVDVQPASVPTADLAARLVENLGSQTAMVMDGGKAATKEARQSALRNLIRQGFDLDRTSQFVLGKSWNRATPEQRAEFRELFTQYLLNSYARHLTTFQADTLTVVSSHPVSDNDILVETSVQGVDGPAAPVWRVRAADGRLKIIDVTVDGVSLALTHRREFGAVINRAGLDGLLHMLREKLATQAKTSFRNTSPGVHASLLASILASPNANRLDLFVAGK